MPRWPPAGVFVGWTGLGVLTAAQLFWIERMTSPTPLGPLACLAIELPPWLVWAATTPLVLAAAQRWPLRQQPIRAIGVHLTLLVLLVGPHLSWNAATYVLLRGGVAHAIPATIAQYLMYNGHFGVLAYAAVLGVGQALQYRDQLHQQALAASQMQAQLARAELGSLRMKVHPHFLFNALNAIAVLIRKQEGATATSMVVGLAELMRASLETPGATVPLERELELLDRYLYIEQTRFGDRLNGAPNHRPGGTDVGRAAPDPATPRRKRDQTRYRPSARTRRLAPPRLANGRSAHPGSGRRWAGYARERRQGQAGPRPRSVQHRSAPGLPFPIGTPDLYRIP